eukprot:CAMPEP_0170547360 /NCGR_PEP_ID=MMETSP0211-20121228/5747_1 /TAXON_ID=311385 /ORGANISM="Pseudokeronopsis sp., Strain OXSARD2" /LENGTH=50 /DNA_ID=CAMNT_0010852357 /DNA_START=2813 /DNA_END=2965 /DNA_ORIENTATION=+
MKQKTIGNESDEFDPLYPTREFQYELGPKSIEYLPQYIVTGFLDSSSSEG